MAMAKEFGRRSRSSFDYNRLSKNGLGVEWVGTHSVKILRGGRFIGLLRKAIGAYKWYPAGYQEPEYQAYDPSDVVEYLVSHHGSSA